MTFTPRSTINVKPLPRARRRFVFLTLAIFFVCAVPLFVFYATGYRYDFFDPDATITATGGLYVSVGADEGEVFLDEMPVRDSRLFREAMYIQNLTPGLKRLHVQAPGLHTWVKELPVYPYIVTEVAAYQLPLVPQVRPITEFQTSTGTAVYLQTSSTTVLFAGVSTTIPFLATTSRATSTFERNSEYAFIMSLFATSTTATSTLLNRVVGEVSDAISRTTGTEVATTTVEMATTTKRVDDLIIREQGDDVVVAYVGTERNIPYYFCVPEAALASTSELYGPSVMRGVALVLAAVPEQSESLAKNRLCRDSIVIDRQGQTIIDFNFFPGTTDLVVLHRRDGVYVVEVDDRSWQNTQPLYPYEVDEVVVNNGRIFAKTGSRVFELIPELPSNQ
jgi:hypothetical protein